MFSIPFCFHCPDILIFSLQNKTYEFVNDILSATNSSVLLSTDKITFEIFGFFYIEMRRLFSLFLNVTYLVSSMKYESITCNLTFCYFNCNCKLLPCWSLISAWPNNSKIPFAFRKDNLLNSKIWFTFPW